MKFIVAKTCLNKFCLTLHNEIPKIMIKQSKVCQRVLSDEFKDKVLAINPPALPSTKKDAEFAYFFC